VLILARTIQRYGYVNRA